MSDCYKFEEINYNNNNYFDVSLSATYIIHLKNNGRYESIIKNIKFFQPTSKTYILFNQGFKNCKKEGISKSTKDLVDCYSTIFKHANDNNYGNILILEDDFNFSKEVNNKNLCTDINNYIIQNENKEYIYILGCLPSLQLSFISNHNRVYISLGTHAIIYSSLFVKNHNNIDLSLVGDWDTYLRNFTKIAYYKPLCFQLFPETENYNNWTDSIDTTIIKFLIKKCNLDKQIYPGYTIFYVMSKILFYIIIIFITTLIFILLKNKKND
jgi:hypothetical protein